MESVGSGVVAMSLPPEAQAAIRAQLDLLLTSPHFRTSKRCHGLLKYVVQAHLELSLDHIKERTIGAAVFGRDPAYDTNQDSVVRTTAAEVRKKLAQYYLEPGRETEIRILLPNGSYVPDFTFPIERASPPPAQPESIVPLVESLPAAPVTARELSPRRSWRWLWIAAAAALTIAAGWVVFHSRPNELELFWSPLIDDHADVALCTGQPLRIYMFDGSRTEELNEKMVGAPGHPPASNQIRQQTTLNLSDLKTAGNRYFSSGDFLASLRLAELLGRKHKPFQALGDRNTTYKDLRGHPAVLIGQFDNQWTKDLTAGLRYNLRRNEQTYSYEVFDRLRSGKTIATVTRDVNRPEEYAIVSRVFSSSTEKTVIAVAGMTYNGTTAAGDFLTNPAYMREAFHNAPSNWYRKNIQVVLKTVMVAGAVGPPQVVATYFW